MAERLPGGKPSEGKGGGFALSLPGLSSRTGWLGLLLSAGALYLSLRRVQWGEAWAALAGVNGLLVASGLIAVMATTLAKAARWGSLLAPDRVCLRRLFFLFLVGQLINGLLPGRLGELARAVLLGERRQLGKARVLGTILVEKFLDVVMLLGVLLSLLVALPLPSWFRSSALPLGGVALSLLGLVCLSTWGQGFLEHISAFLPLSWRRVLLQGVKGMSILRRAGSLSRALAWSGLVWALAAGTNYLLLRAFHLQQELSPLAPFVILVAIHLGALFPTAPAQVGVFHYLCILSLVPFGVEPSVALSYGAVLHLVVYLPIMILGSLGLWRESWNLAELRGLGR